MTTRIMKLKAFTIMESMIVLVLSAITFAVILNAHQLINNIYTLNVNNGKMIEQVAELEKLLTYEAFLCDEIGYEGNDLIFKNELVEVVVRSVEDMVTVSYDHSSGEQKIMTYDIPFRVIEVKRNIQGKVVSIIYDLNYTEAWHTFELTKAYTARQKLKWVV